MMEIMTNEESYADRRQLFKDIWVTAMQIDEKDVENIMAKPKVIKTLRLDEVDKYVRGKRKKERIRNLRTVCKKILDFCDRHDADDMFSEQKTEKSETEEGEEHPQNKLDCNPKKLKINHKRKKFNRAKNISLPKKSSGHRAFVRKDDYPSVANSSRNNSPIKTKRQTFQQTSVTHKRALKANSNPDAEGSNSPTKGSVTRRKVVRKKRSSPNNRSYLSSPAVTGRVIVKRIRQVLTDNVILVT